MSKSLLKEALRHFQKSISCHLLQMVGVKFLALHSGLADETMVSEAAEGLVLFLEWKLEARVGLLNAADIN